MATPGFELGTSGSLVLHSTTAPQRLLVFTYDNFRYLTLVQSIGAGIVLIGPVKDFSFWPHQGLNWVLWMSSPALYHCTMVTSGSHL